MKTDDIYLAKLSMVVGGNCIRPVTEEAVLVKKKGHYPNDVYYEIDTNRVFVADRQAVNVGDVFIDMLAPFNYVTGNTEESIPKKKVLQMYYRVVGGNNG